MSTTPPVPHVSWLSKVGAFIGKVLGIVQKAEPSAVVLAEALLPQFSPEIALANDLFNKIVKQAIVAETTMAAAGTQTGTGAQKLEAVLANIGPDIDQWVANNFPGNKTLSTVSKTGIINSIVAALNELVPPPATPAA